VLLQDGVRGQAMITAVLAGVNRTLISGSKASMRSSENVTAAPAQVVSTPLHLGDWPAATSSPITSVGSSLSPSTTVTMT